MTGAYVSQIPAAPVFPVAKCDMGRPFRAVLTIFDGRIGLLDVSVSFFAVFCGSAC
jgi:hypothetical protein